MNLHLSKQAEAETLYAALRRLIGSYGAKVEDFRFEWEKAGLPFEKIRTIISIRKRHLFVVKPKIRLF